MRSFRQIPLAWKNLVHDPRRLAVTVAGIGFAVFLMFIEMGFKNALIDSTVEVVKICDGELVIISRARYALPARKRFDIECLNVVRRDAAVGGVFPVYFENQHGVLKKVDDRGYPIRVMAFNLDDPVIKHRQIQAMTASLRLPDCALLDTKSKKKYGLADFDDQQLEDASLELADRKLQLVGRFVLGTDFAVDGTLAMSDANFARFFPYRASGNDPLSRVDLAMVKLRPGVDAQSVRARLLECLPQDVDVFTKRDFMNREKRFWNRSTRVGYIFTVGMVMGFVVGIIICYQIIYSDIADHMREFATLKAMGYRNRYFLGLVVCQAIYLSLLGFVPGLLISWGAYRLLASLTGLLLRLTMIRCAVVLGLTAMMCVVSGLFAVRKVLSADPAELF